jgi:hypothetical protein
MFAFQSLGEATWMTLAFVGMGIWALNRMFKKFDSEGKIKKTAEAGVVGLISRWFQK